MNTEKIFSQFPTLETDRLTLRKVDINKDVLVIFDNLYKEPDVNKFFNSNITSVGDNSSENFFLPTMVNKIKRWELAFKNQKNIVWGLELKSNKKLIGIRFVEFFANDIAYLESRLDKNYWNQGLMTEASKAIITFLDLHDVKQFVTVINIRNKAALKLNQKLGFREIDINDLCFVDDVNASPIITTMQQEDVSIFVFPKINIEAFRYFEAGREARSNQNIKNCALLNLKAINIQPNFIPAMNDFAFAKLDLGEPKMAIFMFTEILKLKPNKYTAFLGRAYAYSDMELYENAISDYLSYLKIINDDDDTYVMLGNLYFKLSKFTEALNAYEKALNINPYNNMAIQNKEHALKFFC